MSSKSGTCPKCKRRTYSEKFGQCSGCAYRRGESSVPQQESRSQARRVAAMRGEPAPRFDGNAEQKPPVQPRVVGPANIPTTTAVIAAEPIPEFTRVPDPVLIEGEPCPTCGKPVGKRKAVLQKEYRERKRSND